MGNNCTYNIKNNNTQEENTDEIDTDNINTDKINYIKNPKVKKEDLDIYFTEEELLHENIMKLFSIEIKKINSGSNAKINIIKTYILKSGNKFEKINEESEYYIDHIDKFENVTKELEKEYKKYNIYIGNPIVEIDKNLTLFEKEKILLIKFIDTGNGTKIIENLNVPENLKVQESKLPVYEEIEFPVDE